MVDAWNLIDGFERVIGKSGWKTKSQGCRRLHRFLLLKSAARYILASFAAISESAPFSQALLNMYGTRSSISPYGMYL